MVRMVTAQDVSETGSRCLPIPAIWPRIDVTCILRSRRCKLLANHTTGEGKLKAVC